MFQRIVNGLSEAIKGKKEEPKRNSNKPAQVVYESNDVPLPDDFLVSPPAQPITANLINFKDSPVPEYDGHYAVILDNVLSASECTKLLELSEASVADASLGEDGSPWRRAMVNVGAGYEVFTPSYRNGDRLIWDNQEIVDRIWARCLLAPGVKESLSTAIIKDPVVLGQGRYELRRDENSAMRFARVNNRMRFLKYSGGEFFRPHRDASYGEETGDGRYQESLFTLHLYLNDSQAEVGDAAELVGGATPFLSRDEKRRIDVNPRAGRVLIFQQRGLLHSGDDVKKGVKYTMRTDIMYQLM
ncbi:hypothetical protein OQA88_6458 [Cercophora sp. LCS_1]